MVAEKLISYATFCSQIRIQINAKFFVGNSNYGNFLAGNSYFYFGNLCLCSHINASRKYFCNYKTKIKPNLSKLIVHIDAIVP